MRKWRSLLPDEGQSEPSRVCISKREQLTVQDPDARVVSLEAHSGPCVLQHKHGVAINGVLEVVLVRLPLAGIKVAHTPAGSMSSKRSQERQTS